MAPTTHQVTDRAPACRAGATLVELLAVISVIAALIGLLAPSLARVRVQAQQAAATSAARQHAAIMIEYGADHDGWFPMLTNPNATFTLIRWRTWWGEFRYFDVYQVWNLALAEAYYDGDALSDVFHSPFYLARFDRAQLGAGTSFYYSNTCIARPDYWNARTRRGDRSQWRAVGQAETTHPSHKAILIDRGAWALGELAPDVFRHSTAFADGSARAVATRDFLPPYPHGNGGPPGSMTTAGIPTLHTINGVHGRDVR